MTRLIYNYLIPGVGLYKETGKFLVTFWLQQGTHRLSHLSILRLHNPVYLAQVCISNDWATSMYMPDKILLPVGHHVMEIWRHKPTSYIDIVGKIDEICKIFRFVVKFHIGMKPQPISLYHRFIKFKNTLCVKTKFGWSRLHTLFKLWGVMSFSSYFIRNVHFRGCRWGKITQEVTYKCYLWQMCRGVIFGTEIEIFSHTFQRNFIKFDTLGEYFLWIQMNSLITFKLP